MFFREIKMVMMISVGKSRSSVGLLSILHRVIGVGNIRKLGGTEPTAKADLLTYVLHASATMTARCPSVVAEAIFVNTHHNKI